jgi:DNA repair ATPase RecN
MKSNWWISKQNQLLFIWDAVYEQITKKNFYDWEDWDNNRLSEFENAMDSIEVCWKKYREQITSYMKQQSAEARQQSIEATNEWLKQITRYYELCKNNPTAINSKELEETKKYAKLVIQNCKKYNIDYKSKLSSEILKFYGVE